MVDRSFRYVAVLVLLGLCCGDIAAQESKEALTTQYQRDFKGLAEKSPEWGFAGQDAAKFVKFEPEGVRITLLEARARRAPGGGPGHSAAFAGRFRGHVALRNSDRADRRRGGNGPNARDAGRAPGAAARRRGHMVAPRMEGRREAILVLDARLGRGRGQTDAACVGRQDRIEIRTLSRMSRTGTMLSYLSAEAKTPMTSAVWSAGSSAART